MFRWQRGKVKVARRGWKESKERDKEKEKERERAREGVRKCCDEN